MANGTIPGQQSVDPGSILPRPQRRDETASGAVTQKVRGDTYGVIGKGEKGVSVFNPKTGQQRIINERKLSQFLDENRAFRRGSISKEPTRFSVSSPTSPRGIQLSEQEFEQFAGRRGGFVTPALQQALDVEQQRSGIISDLGLSTGNIEQGAVADEIRRRAEFIQNIPEAEQSELQKEFLRQLREGETPSTPPTSFIASIIQGLNSRLRKEEAQLKPEELKDIQTMEDYYKLPPELQRAVRNETVKKGEKTVDSIMSDFLRLGGGFSVLGIGVEQVLDVIGKRKKADQLQSALGKVGTIATTLEGIHSEAGDSTEKSLSRLRSLSTDLAILERDLKLATIQDPTIKTSDQYSNILVDIEDQRTTIEEQVAKVLNDDRAGFNPRLVDQYTDELAEIFEKDKQAILRGLEDV